MPTQPDKPFYNANDRSNNHFDIYSKYIPINKSYRIRVRNTGDKPFIFSAGANSRFDNPNTADVWTLVQPGTQGEWALGGIKINNNVNNDNTELYKINCYNR